MTLAQDDLVFLTSPAGEQLLLRLAQTDLSDQHTLSLVTALRRDYNPQQASAALEMARLRLKAQDKFGAEAQRMFFTREALEQASDPLIRKYRAERLGKTTVVDTCCGIGSDALAFAQAGANVVGLDQDSLRVAIAQQNATVLGLTIHFEVGDVTKHVPMCDMAFFDPARRDDKGNRIYDVDRYQPPLSTIRRWKHSQIAVKLSPGVELEQLEPYDGLVEFISVGGDLKESVLWTGFEGKGLQATLLSDGKVLHWTEASDGEQIPDKALLSDPQMWLVEPDPALIRAGLVQDVARAFGGQLLDETIAYFTTSSHPVSPWVRAWRILDWMPFNVKRLRAHLREHQVGRITVKKRGTAVTPDTLIPQLKLGGSEERVLVLTRNRGHQITMICAPYEAQHLTI